jgi:hypothetical protein
MKARRSTTINRRVFAFRQQSWNCIGRQWRLRSRDPSSGVIPGFGGHVLATFVVAMGIAFHLGARWQLTKIRE